MHPAVSAVGAPGWLLGGSSAPRPRLAPRQVLDVVRQATASVSAPIVLFTYYNPIMARGLDKFCRQAREAGATGERRGGACTCMCTGMLGIVRWALAELDGSWALCVWAFASGMGGEQRRPPAAAAAAPRVNYLLFYRTFLI